MSRQFFIAKGAIAGDRASLPAELARHLGTVLRLATGDEIVLLDGNGGHYRCRITDLDRQAGTAQVLERWQADEQALPFELIQGIPKGDKMDLILQKGTELGVGRFSPVWTERSVPAPTVRVDKKLQRWQRIVGEAARQSRRPILPQCSAPAPLATALEECRTELKLMLWEEGGRPLQDVLPPQPPASVAILVGPEGGFSSTEAQQAADRGFVAVHLGPRILRTETAGFAVSAVLQYLYGDFGASGSELDTQPKGAQS